MAAWAKFPDGVEVDERIFKTLAEFAPEGDLDVFASDQHNSYLKLMASFYQHIGSDKKSDDNDVRDVCRLFAGALEGHSKAALFNHLAFQSDGFKDLLGRGTMLIGRLENTFTEPTADGIGQLANLSVQPEDIADTVDGYKTLVKLDPDHEESWNKNLEWIQDVFERVQKLGKPLFNETLMYQREGESKEQMAARLPEGLVKIAEAFGPYGHFYKTQVPFLWVEENGSVVKTATADTVRETGEAMLDVVDRPMLLLSAAVDFEQFAAQYALVADVFAGPMCGRAYFKEAFSMPETKDFDSLGQSFKKIVHPRIKQIKGLSRVLSQPWWHKFNWVSDEAKQSIKMDARPKATGVKADYGY